MDYDYGLGEAVVFGPLLKGVAEEFGVEIPGFAVAIEEYRLGAKIGDGVGCCDKGQGRAEYLVIRLDAEQAKPKMHGCGAARQRHRWHADMLRKFAFEGVDVGSDGG